MTRPWWPKFTRKISSSFTMSGKEGEDQRNNSLWIPPKNANWLNQKKRFGIWIQSLPNQTPKFHVWVSSFLSVPVFHHKVGVTQRRLVTIQQQWLWANHFCWQSQTRLTMTLVMRNIGYSKDVMRTLLGGGFNFLLLLLLLGEMIQFDYFFSIYKPYTLKKSSTSPTKNKYARPPVLYPPQDFHIFVWVNIIATSHARKLPQKIVHNYGNLRVVSRKSGLVKSSVRPDTWNSLKVQVKINMYNTIWYIIWYDMIDIDIT